MTRRLKALLTVLGLAVAAVAVVVGLNAGERSSPSSAQAATTSTTVAGSLVGDRRGAHRHGGRWFGGLRPSPRQFQARRDALFADLGERLGLSSAKVKAGVRSLLADMLATAVKRGRLTAAQRAAILNGFDAGLPGAGMRAMPFGRHRGFRGPHPRRNSGINRAARLNRLFGQLGAKLGRSGAQVKAATRAVLADRLTKAVKAGRVTSAQRNRMLQRFDHRTR